MFALEEACREREREIDTLAATYVRAGMAPWPAMERAGRVVGERRRIRSMLDAIADDAPAPSAGGRAGGAEG
jgi:hypothetical protein